ncbi:hypothetical protein FOA52_006519 [Chlamydomonas sp. UWO 241]|nr:hypothetical protein FOA52_006519 [Chlamydomonas sp. UWO 241]
MGMVPVSRASPWAVGLCSVLFDVDVGPKVEALTPAGCLSTQEQQDVAFHAFPDSMSMELRARSTIRDSSFFFRVKRRGKPALQQEQQQGQQEQQQGQAQGKQGGAASVQERFLYGFVFCRQRQDASLRRGGEQLSVVVLSEHPYSSVLRPLSQVAGPAYLSSGHDALKALWDEVATWPAPAAGPLLALTAGPIAAPIAARLPPCDTLPWPSTAPPGSAHAHFASRGSSGLLARTSTGHHHLHHYHSAPPRSGTRSGGSSVLERFDSSAPEGYYAAAAAAASVSVPGEAHVESPNGAGGSGHTFGVFTHTSRTSSVGVDDRTMAQAQQQGQQGTFRTGRTMSGAGGVGDVHGTSALGVFGEVDVYTSMRAHLPRLWQLWEMALCGEPLLVVGLTPSDSSSAVAALVSLLAPLPLRLDFRPYYTIHDPTFKALSSGALPRDDPCLPVLVGVTNLYFLKALSHWPSVMSVGHPEASTWTPSTPSVSAVSAVLNPGAAVRALRQRARGAQSLMYGHTEGVWSPYRALVRPDASLLQRLKHPGPDDPRSKVARNAAANNDALRRHFHDMTVALLAPFARYCEPGADGLVPRWHPGQFMDEELSLTQLLPSFTDRYPRASDQHELYRRFVATSNFRAWIGLQQGAVAHLLEPEPLPTGPGGRALDDVELVERFFDAEQQLQRTALSVARTWGPGPGADGPGAAVDAGTGTGAASEDEAAVQGGNEHGGADGAVAPAQQQDNGGGGVDADGSGSGGAPSRESPASGAASFAGWAAVGGGGTAGGVGGSGVGAAASTAAAERAELLKLRRQLAALFLAMPEDLQATVVSSPSRRLLLAGLQEEMSVEQQQRLQQLVSRLK